MRVGKNVLIYKLAEKELLKFPRSVQIRFKALFEILSNQGTLKEPFAKKLSSQKNLFELRVKHQGQWRAIYAYVLTDTAIVISAFAKKTQKTPKKELAKAIKRLKNYLKEL